MFDEIPVRVWLLVAIAVAAYAPARYVLQHVVASTSRRDITQPPVDLSWRTSQKFVRSASILAGLVGLAIFIFTPAAEQFARSASFWPILLAGLGAWAIYTVPMGLVSGRVQPFIRGIHTTYSRQDQPKRFWASLAWNAMLGTLCAGFAYPMYTDALEQPLKDRCYADSKTNSAQDMLSACNKLIASRDTSDSDFADLVGARAYVYYRLGDFTRSMADYDEGIRLQPDDADAYLGRGLIFLDTDKLDQAVTEFTRAHERDEEDVWPLANRGITYALKKDRVHAEQDFRAVRALDPSNPVMLRGEALLAFDAGDLDTSLKLFSESLTRDPDNIWALRMRSEVYLKLGAAEKSRADTDKADQLSRSEAKALPVRT